MHYLPEWRIARCCGQRENRTSAVWANLKGRELANLCSETLDEPIRAAYRGVERVRSDEDLLFGFSKATGLSL
jgi:hypothetical protein